MEAIALNDLLDEVKKIVTTTRSATHDDFPVLPTSIPALPEWAKTLPEGSIPLTRALERVTQNVLPYLNRSSLSPRYYGFVTGGVTPAAQIGDILAGIYDQNVMVHLPQETISTEVEVTALNMLVDLFQLPGDDWKVGTAGNGGGILTTGATASNVVGLVMGREFVLREAARRATGEHMSAAEHGILAVSQAGRVDCVQVLSTMAHSSIIKTAAIAGIGRQNVVDIAKHGSATTIDMDKIRHLLEHAEQDRKAYILSISAGEVNTGHNATESLDMMQQLRDLCNRYGVWIHVDGAFGIFGRILLGHTRESEFSGVVDGVRGLELADSITADGHKLLNVPYDCGIFLTRHKDQSEAVFTNGGAAYLATNTVSTIQNPGNIGIENSRRFRALPVYCTLSAYGREGYADMLIRQISLSRKLAAWLFDHEKYELLPAGQDREQAISKTFMIVLFKAKDESSNQSLVQRIKDTGKMYVSPTAFGGVSATRLAISNWRVDVDSDFEAVSQILDSLV